MTEIRFYHLTRQTQEQALPLLLGKAYDGGRRVVLKLQNAQEIKRMNEHLWTFDPNSFLPHGSKADGNADMQPIWLTDMDENPNEAQVLILGHGASAQNHKDFDLCCELLDGQDEHAVKGARQRWKSYKEQGFEVTYWQQNDRGGWQQKA
jgi:DNA polymerase-3 subunit chi